jgi:hypothetical protein
MVRVVSQRSGWALSALILLLPGCLGIPAEQRLYFAAQRYLNDAGRPVEPPPDNAATKRPPRFGEYQIHGIVECAGRPFYLLLSPDGRAWLQTPDVPVVTIGEFPLEIRCPLPRFQAEIDESESPAEPSVSRESSV